LYGRKFKIVTDHAALKWLITVKNHHCARLTRWVLKLSEYDFEIVHKAGKKHVNADYLSRRISSVSTDRDRKPLDDNLGKALTRETVFTAQHQDTECMKIIQEVRDGIEPGYLISEDGILYEVSDLRHARLFVPEKLIRPVLELHHDKVFAGHQGVKRTCDLVKLRYFWPNMDRDIEAYVQQCDSCAKLKAGRQPTAPLGELPETTFPFEMTSIDICGPYPETRKGNRYLLTFIDHFSRYPETIPIPRQDASTVARALVTEIFSRTGCPQALSSDRGSNFMSELFQEMCKLLGIRRINSTAFNPQMQGKIEKFHLGLNQTMSHYVNKYGNDWDEFVNYALMAHRAIPHSVTRYSPFYLLHGQQMRLPMEDDLTAARFMRREPTDGRDSIQSHIHTLAERLEEAYRVTRDNNRIGRKRQKEQYDKGTKLVTFQPGEIVYLREMTKGKRGCPKFRVRWRGPYEVLRRLSDWNYLVKIARNKETVVNVNKMKRCHKVVPQSTFNHTDTPIRTPRGGTRDNMTEREDALSSDEDDSTNILGRFDSVLPATSRDRAPDSGNRKELGNTAGKPIVRRRNNGIRGESREQV
jgi:transposase InsO family protein